MSIPTTALVYLGGVVAAGYLTYHFTKSNLLTGLVLAAGAMYALQEGVAQQLTNSTVDALVKEDAKEQERSRAQTKQDIDVASLSVY
jgi:hypothetical protein